MEYELIELPELGFIQIIEIGEENMYFIYDDKRCFIKLG